MEREGRRRRGRRINKKRRDFEEIKDTVSMPSIPTLEPSLDDTPIELQMVHLFSTTQHITHLSTITIGILSMVVGLGIQMLFFSFFLLVFSFSPSLPSSLFLRFPLFSFFLTQRQL